MRSATNPIDPAFKVYTHGWQVFLFEEDSDGDQSIICSLETLKEHSAQMTDVAVSPNDEWFASVSNDQTVKIWSPSCQTSLKTLKGHTK